MSYINRLANLSPLKSFAPAASNSRLRLADGTSHSARPAILDGFSTSKSKTKSILVPLDGSIFAEQAIPVALAIAAQTGAMLNLVHVVVPAEALDPYDALYFADASLKSLKREKRRYLKRLIDKIGGASSTSVTSRVTDGRDVSASLDGVSGLDADLVVMATHGRGTLGRCWSGSVAHSLLQRTSVPVIVVRGTEQPVTFSAEPIDHVLLPLDGSEASETVLRPIMELGIFPTARHSLLQVVPLLPKHVVRDYTIHTDWVPSRRRWASGMQYLHPLARSLRDDGRAVHTKVVSSDEPFWQVVLRCAEKDNAGLIAVAYTRQSSIARLLWPNTSEHLFRNSLRPVMFVPSELP
jgi:nucleotide-binding universal stress UspA family protein